MGGLRWSRPHPGSVLRPSAETSLSRSLRTHRRRQKYSPRTRMANSSENGSRDSAQNAWPRATAGSGMAGKAAEGEDTMIPISLPTLPWLVFLSFVLSFEIAGATGSEQVEDSL